MFDGGGEDGSFYLVDFLRGEEVCFFHLFGGPCGGGFFVLAIVSGGKWIGVLNNVVRGGGDLKKISVVG